MQAHEIDRALILDSRWCEDLRGLWLDLIREAMFEQLAGTRLGALPRVRRRAFELGEKIASLLASRAWIPHPREQLKSALACALELRDSLAQLDAAIAEITPSAQRDTVRVRLSALAMHINAQLPQLEQSWARSLSDLGPTSSVSNPAETKSE
jgi:hypothetical protein